ncbi:MAG: hypothetical protein N2442_06275 [Spirochaetes bacterium]|nr:hypothetical protein [Spirochaetota bacterium]
MENELNFLARKAGFNTALRHFKLVNRYVGEIQEGANLADLLNESLESGEVRREQVKTILSALLVDKFSYVFRSHNIQRGWDDVKDLLSVFRPWDRIQLVLMYASPQAGTFLINPKKAEHWEQALPLIKDELVVVYAGPVGSDSVDGNILDTAVKDTITLLDGGKISTRPEYTSPKRKEVAPIEERVPKTSPTVEASKGPSVKKRMTPKYGVLVTNELFHNGNVEAWKRIIESYKAKYPDLDVLIWYENERINDINALFKWGKVKHGTPIMISVVGDNIKDVAKLQKYLYEGASPRFEVFLRGAVNRVLDLF